MSEDPSGDIANCCSLPGRAFDENNEKKEHDTSQIASKESPDMIRLQAGKFLMGTEATDGFPGDGEGPIREVHLDAFDIDSTAVTNREFRRFIRDTGYTTESERFGWSYVFKLLVSKRVYKTALKGQLPELPWWLAINGANWKNPEGPGTNIKKRPDHPVVHVSWNDAIAYCEWADKRLPSEAEWEYAARGGLQQARYAWGDDLTPDGEHMCNIWQGKFPDLNSMDDGHLGTAPVKSFLPNGFGLYEVSGNVWEWCADWFSVDFHLDASLENPLGPDSGDGRVMRGGSFLCHDSYCNRYRVGARSRNTPDTGTSNLGFRCARDQ